VPLLLEKPFAVPFASALRQAGLPPSWEAYRQELVVRRAAHGEGDGNRECARILQLCLTHPLEQVTAALEVAAIGGHYSVEAVRHLVRGAEQAQETKTSGAPPAPLDPGTYPQYQRPQPRPNLTAYNQLLAAGASAGAGLASPGKEGHA